MTQSRIYDPLKKPNNLSVNEGRVQSLPGPVLTASDSFQDGPTKGFAKLLVWRRGIELTIAVYVLTAEFPITERFGLSSQMRRAAVSVPSNVAEGYGRRTRGEYLQFLGQARGSCSELETQIVISKKLNLGSAVALSNAEALCAETGRLLFKLMAALEK